MGLVTETKFYFLNKRAISVQKEVNSGFNFSGYNNLDSESY
jgi:hypothetical protein